MEASCLVVESRFRLRVFAEGVLVEREGKPKNIATLVAYMIHCFATIDL